MMFDSFYLLFRVFQQLRFDHNHSVYLRRRTVRHHHVAIAQVQAQFVILSGFPENSENVNKY